MSDANERTRDPREGVMTMHKIEVEMSEDDMRSIASGYTIGPITDACWKWVEENPELIPVTTWLTPDEVKARAKYNGGHEYNEAAVKFNVACREVDL